MPADDILDRKWTIRFQGYAFNMLRGTWIHSAFHIFRRMKQHLMRRSEGERILLERYIHVHGKRLDLANPQTFTEKLFWRMISLNQKQNCQFMQVADKYAARAYAGSRVGEQYLVKLLWQGEKPSQIPFDS